LDPERYEVYLAADTRYAPRLPEADVYRLAIHSIPSEQFLAALAAGRPAHDAAVLRSHVEEDLRVLSEVAPDLGVGDFRLSLTVSAPMSCVPYMAITNAYRGPYAKQRYPVRELPPWTNFLPIPSFQRIFDLVRPLAFAHHARALNQVRREYRLPGPGWT
jgi:UDP:flavonoid glycosyltransferase YjiC (YdhE family)